MKRHGQHNANFVNRKHTGIKKKHNKIDLTFPTMFEV